MGCSEVTDCKHIPRPVCAFAVAWKVRRFRIHWQIEPYDRKLAPDHAICHGKVVQVLCKVQDRGFACWTEIERASEHQASASIEHQVSASIGTKYHRRVEMLI